MWFFSSGLILQHARFFVNPRREDTFPYGEGGPGAARDG